MNILILLIGLFIGFSLNLVISKILKKISPNKNLSINIFPVITYEVCFFVAYIRFGLSVLFLKALVLIGLLVIVSFIDLETRIIPDFMVVIILAAGITFSCFGGASLRDSIFGMLTGGAVLFLLALVPNAMGGGDIKLMFAVGTFLGVNKTLWSILLAFIIASIAGLLLLIFKVIGRKDHIPFGPFLALGSFISLMIFT